MIVAAGGAVGIGTATPAHALDVVGDIHASGCVSYNGGSVRSCASDMRLKTDIQPFLQTLDKLVRLRPVHFNWKASNPPEYRFGSERNAGLIAQEVQQVFPEMVTMDKNGYRRVNYSDLPFLVLEGVRELKVENDSLKNTASKQQDEIRAQRVQLEKQQEQIAQLASQMTVIQASLREQHRTRPAVHVAKAHGVTMRNAARQATGHVAGNGR